MMNSPDKHKWQQVHWNDFWVGCFGFIFSYGISSENPSPAKWDKFYWKLFQFHDAIANKFSVECETLWSKYENAIRMIAQQQTQPGEHMQLRLNQTPVIGSIN